MNASASPLPEGFVYLSDIESSILQDIRYASDNNFVGKPVDGYDKAKAISTVEAANALKSVQAELNKKGMSLLVYDAYRPQRAVDHFVVWSKDPSQETKKAYYPDLEKGDLFKLGYIAPKHSSHTRGSTVDLTIVTIPEQIPLDMGTPFDFFGESSHPNSVLVSKEAQENRKLLRDVMLKNGFEPLETEWWHFTLKDEPFKERYFDFPVA